MKFSSLAAVCLISFLGVSAAPAFAWQSSSTVTGPNGRSATRSATRMNGNVSSTVTGSNGRVWGRTVSRQPGQTSATLSGPNGGTSTRVTSY